MLDRLRNRYQESSQLRAVDLLCDPSAYPAMKATSPHRLKLQVYEIPSFYPIITWSLYQMEESDYLLRRVRWDFAEDYAVPWDKPTTFASDALIPGEKMESHLAELSKIAVPVFDLKDGIGLDGTTMGLRRYGGMGNFAEYAWWGDPPEACQPLADWHQGFVGWLESLLPKHTVPAEERIRRTR